ncbi:MAG: DNA repair protein RadA, partial [Mycobacteriales bacterium]
MSAKGRERAAYHCTECGATAPRWIGRCTECHAWGTVIEDGRPAAAALRAGPVSGTAVPIAQVDATAAAARPTGIEELDRVLGGGLVKGAVILLAGEPGVGKSTLLLDLAHRWSGSIRGGRTLVVTGEESAAQVRLRAERTRNLADELYLAAETDLAAVVSHVDQVRPNLLIIDSVQTIAASDVDGSAGGVTQVRAVAAALIALAKARGIATVLVGHVTKDGNVAGPRLLEHLVDVVLQFDGDRHTALRMIRASKNRYGPADEVGCFELVDSGIVGLNDPSGLFLSHRSTPVPGTCTTVVLEGRRPLVAEIQALAVRMEGGGSPRRTVTGLDSARFSMLAAVVGRHGVGPAFRSDLYGATVGGVRITETAADLAVAISIASAVRDKPVSTTLVAFGEVGLAGDVRRVSGIGRRLAEAARLGFETAIVPAGQGDEAPRGITVHEVRDVVTMLRRLGIESAEVADLSSRSARPPRPRIAATGSGRAPIRFRH